MAGRCKCSEASDASDNLHRHLKQVMMKEVMDISKEIELLMELLEGDGLSRECPFGSHATRLVAMEIRRLLDKDTAGGDIVFMPKRWKSWFDFLVAFAETALLEEGFFEDAAFQSYLDPMPPKDKCELDGDALAKFSTTELYQLLKTDAQESVTEDKEIIWPLEVIWTLHDKYMMNFYRYLLRLSGSPVAFKAFTAQLTNLGCNATVMQIPLARRIFMGIFSLLLFMQYCDKKRIYTDPSAREVQKLSAYVVAKAGQALLDSTLTESADSSYNFWDVLTTEKDLEPYRLQFCTYQLEIAMTKTPVCSLSEALQDQHQWTIAGTSPMLIDLLKSSAETFKVIEGIVEKDVINWKLIILITSVALMEKDSANEKLNSTTEHLFCTAFTKQDEKLFAAALLLTRQAYLENGVITERYSNWFYKTFQSQDTIVTNHSSTLFAVMALTGLVPYETASFLRAQIGQASLSSKEYRSLWNDYVDIAKTRLKDLAERRNQGKSKISDKALADALDALNTFESTGKIPQRVYKVHIFRSAYYNNEFLPAIMDTSIFPDNPDCQMMFIESLKSSGKMPDSLYSTYMRRRKKLDDNAWQEALGRVDETLKRLTTLVQTSKLDETAASQLSAELADELSEVAISPDGDNTSIQWDDLKSCDPLLIQVAKMLLKGWTSLVESADLLHDWIVNCYFLPLVPYLDLQRALYSCIWHATELKGSDDLIPVPCLAALLFWIGYLKDQFAPVQLAGHGSLTVTDCIFAKININNDQSMQLCFELATLHLKQAQAQRKTSGKHICSTYAVKKFILLYGYFHAIKKTSKEHLKLKKYAETMSTVTFEDWLQFESQIDLSKEMLRKGIRRLDYMMNMFLNFIRETESAEESLQAVVHLLTDHNSSGIEHSSTRVHITSLLLLAVQHVEVQTKLPPNTSWFTNMWLSDQFSGSNQLMLELSKRLPPWIFVSNSQQEKPTSEALKKLAELLNGKLENILRDGFCYPLSIASHFLSVSMDKSHIILLLDSVPGLKLSLLVHYLDLGKDLGIFHYEEVEKWAVAVASGSVAPRLEASPNEKALMLSTQILKRSGEPDWDKLWSVMETDLAAQLFEVLLYHAASYKLNGNAKLHVHQGISTAIKNFPWALDYLQPEKYSSLDIFSMLSVVTKKKVPVVALQMLAKTVKQNPAMFTSKTAQLTEICTRNFETWEGGHQFSYLTASDSDWIDRVELCKSEKILLRLKTQNTPQSTSQNDSSLLIVTQKTT